jgi:hypothetical protein
MGDSGFVNLDFLVGGANFWVFGALALFFLADGFLTELLGPFLAITICVVARVFSFIFAFLFSFFI